MTAFALVDGRLAALRVQAGRDPDRARREVHRVLEQLRVEGDPLRADAAYLAAQLATELGEPEDALALISEAEVAYRGWGRDVEAARCDLGRMHVLDELGRHAEAVATGERLVAAYAGSTDPAARAVLVDAWTNLGNACSRLGDYADALRHLHRARELVPPGEPLRTVRIAADLGDVLTELGRPADALAVLEGAWPTAIAEGLDADAACLARNAGEAACLLGRPDEGLAWFQRAGELVGRRSADEIGLGVDLADALARLGCREDAAHRFAAAADAAEARGLAMLAARALHGAGACWATLGARTRASVALTRAAELLEPTPEVPLAALVELELAHLGALGGEVDEAAQRLRHLAGRLDPRRWPVHACLARLQLGCVLGSAPDAEAHLVVALRLAEALPIARLRYQAASALGRWLYARGRPYDAASWLKRALDEARGVGDRLHHDILAREFPNEVAATAALLGAVHAHRGDAASVLAAASEERRRWHDALPGPPVGKLPTRQEQLERRLDRCYDQLLGLAEADEDLTGVKRVTRDLESELRRVTVDGALTAGLRPAREVSREPRVPPWMLLYHATADELFVVVGRPGALHVRPLPAAPADVEAAVTRLHEAARRALVGSAMVAQPGRVHRAVDTHLDRVAELLLEPIAGLLEGVDGSTLVVAPHGAGHGVPFGALPVGGIRLGDRVAVVTTPSLEQWAASERSARAPGHAVVVGVDAGGLVAIPEEVRRVAEQWPDVSALDGSAATIEALRAAIRPDTTCLHLAAHGIYNPHAPDRSGVRLADGWLTVGRVAGLPLSGATVVLSACDGARGTVAPGEDVHGLARAFFRAGACNVVASVWPAEDCSTPQLMSALHRHLARGVAGPEALRRAQRDIRSDAGSTVSWAGFVVSGASSRVDGDRGSRITGTAQSHCSGVAARRGTSC
jgi:CHAT domain-containing protein/tetratricopeptide (TPR) repeat protein